MPVQPHTLWAALLTCMATHTLAGKVPVETNTKLAWPKAAGLKPASLPTPAFIVARQQCTREDGEQETALTLKPSSPRCLASTCLPRMLQAARGGGDRTVQRGACAAVHVAEDALALLAASPMQSASHMQPMRRGCVACPPHLTTHLPRHGHASPLRPPTTHLKPQYDLLKMMTGFSFRLRSTNSCRGGGFGNSGSTIRKVVKERRAAGL